MYAVERSNTPLCLRMLVMCSVYPLGTLYQSACGLQACHVHPASLSLVTGVTVNGEDSEDGVPTTTAAASPFDAVYCSSASWPR